MVVFLSESLHDILPPSFDKFPSSPPHISISTARKMDSLHSRLLAADEMFLSILSGDATDLEDFNESWSNIQATLDHAIKHKTVSDQTLALAHKVASGIETVTGSFLELYDEVDTLAASLRRELENLFYRFAQLSLEDRVASSIPNKPAEESTTAQFPSYIKPAYTWLLSNLHNPYPSKLEKSAIAAETNSSIGYLDNWFRDVRRRIGWTELCKRHFSNKRILIVEAATRYFKQVQRVLKPAHFRELQSEINKTADHDVYFIQIESSARDLYSGKFDRSSLATTLDAAVKDLTPEIQARVRVEQINHKSNPALSYPSPNRSPQQTSSVLPSSRQPSLEQGTSRKRRNNRSPEAENDDRRASKRSKPNSPPVSDDAALASLPSPVSSIVELPSMSLPSSSTLTQTAPSPQLAVTGKRKRQLSDANDHTSSTPPLPIPTSSPQPNFSRKRRRQTPDVGDHSSLSAPLHVSTSASFACFEKRRRELSDEGEETSPTTPLSTEAPSVQPIVSDISSPAPSTPSILVTPVADSSKRKRRLSDADDQMRAKRPHNAMITPRHQTVSDPFPISKPADSESFASWWQECIRTGNEIDMVNIHVPAAVETLDDSTPLDIHYEAYNYADVASSIPDLNSWQDCLDPPINATLFSTSNTGEIFFDEAFSNVPGNLDVQNDFEGFVHAPFFESQNSAFNANVNECSTSYSNNNLFLPEVIDQTTGMRLFAGLSLPESWTFDDFNPGPQLFMPQLIPDSISSTPSIHDSYGLDDKVAKHERAERLREELRRLEADLAS